MKITDVTTTILDIPYTQAFADGTTRHAETSLVTCFVHVKTDVGLEGLGLSRPAYPVQGVIEKTLKKVLVGQNALDIEKLWDDMFWRVRGGGRKGIAICALSAVDIALWDLKAKYFGVPLYKLLGPYTDSVPIYGSGGWASMTTDELVEEMVGYAERGMRAVKMKVGRNFGANEQEDVARLAEVRKALGDRVDIYVDANNGYYAKQAIRLAKEFARYNAAWFEEPVLADDIDGLAAIAKAIDIPIATGEHEYTKYGFRDLIARGGADIVQPDVGRVGGVTEWLKVAHLAHAFNLPVAPHSFQLVHVHLCCATPNLKIVEFLGRHEETDKIMYKEIPEPVNGMLSPFPDKPGLGLELDPVAVKKYAV
jgi:L-alanine-DL-glutamate epimerase-like enolase superfamily enzyme